MWEDAIELWPRESARNLRIRDVCQGGGFYSKVEGSTKERVYQSRELPGSIQEALLRFRQSGLKQ
jgi:hypothetical protein